MTIKAKVSQQSAFDDTHFAIVGDSVSFPWCSLSTELRAARRVMFFHAVASLVIIQSFLFLPVSLSSLTVHP